jgi:hypothetical protein
MEYHWHKSNLGDLWLCKDAITSLANMNMPDGYRAIDATLLGEEGVASLVIAAPPDKDLKAEEQLKVKLDHLFATLGLKVQVSWAAKGEDIDLLSLIDKLRKRPIFWAIIVSIVVGISQLGIKGLGLCVLFGLIGWVVAEAIISGKLSNLISHFMDRRH